MADSNHPVPDADSGGGKKSAKSRAALEFARGIRARLQALGRTEQDFKRTFGKSARDWLNALRLPRSQETYGQIADDLQCEVGELFLSEKGEAAPNPPPNPLRFTMSNVELMHNLPPLKEQDDIVVLADRLLIQSPSSKLPVNIKVLLHAVQARVTFLVPKEDFFKRGKSGWVPDDILLSARKHLDPAAASRLRVFAVDTSLMRVGRVSGMVAFVFERSSRQNGPKVVFEEVRATAPYQTHTDNRWLKIQNAEAKALWEDVRLGVIPVENPSWTKAGHPGTVRNTGQKQFEPQRYELLRELSTFPYATSQKLVKRLRKFVQADGKRPLEVVEIGPGSMKTSDQLLLGAFRESGAREFCVLGLEPSWTYDEPTKEMNRHKAAYLDTTFEDWKPRRLYDLAVSLHSWYHIDVECLAKLVAVLRPGGQAVLVLGAFKGNVICQMARAVDLWVGKETSMQGGNPSSSANPFRTHAEEVESWLTSKGLLDGDPLEVNTELDVTGWAGSRDDPFPKGTKGRQILDYFLGKKATRFEAWANTGEAKKLWAALSGRTKAVQIQKAFVIRRPASGEDALFRRSRPVVRNAGPEAEGGAQG